MRFGNKSLAKALAKEVTKNPKTFWRYVKSKTDKNKNKKNNNNKTPKNSIPQLQKDDGRTTEHNLDKANTMNN